MSVEKKRLASGDLRYRAKWRNPITGRVESGAWLDTLLEARKADAEVKVRLKFDRQSFAPPDAPGGPLTTFGQVAALYVQRAALADSTRKFDVYHLRAICRHVAHVPAEEMDHEALRSLELALREDGNKQNTVNRRVALVRAILSWAVEYRILAVNPALGYRCKRGPDLRIPPPTPAEVKAILAAAPDHLRRAILVSYYVGVRVGGSELFRLTWADVDWERQCVRFQAADKNDARPWREVHIHADLFPLLSTWDEADKAARASVEDEERRKDLFTRVINFRGEAVASVKTAWRRALALAGITRRIRPYDLRHAFATEALSAGADLKAVSEAMGHSTTAMVLRHYQHVLDSHRRAAVQALPSVLCEAVERGQHAGATNEGFSGVFLLPEQKIPQ